MKEQTSRSLCGGTSKRGNLSVIGLRERGHRQHENGEQQEREACAHGGCVASSLAAVNRSSRRVPVSHAVERRPRVSTAGTPA